MPRILVVSISNLVKNPRVLKEVRTLAAAGYDVELLTASISEAFAKEDHRLLGPSGVKLTHLGRKDGSFAARAQDFLHRAARKSGYFLNHRFGTSLSSPLGPTRGLLRRALARPADLTIGHVEGGVWVACELLRRGRNAAVDFEDWHSEDLLPEDRNGRPVGLLRSLERFAVAHAAYWSATSRTLEAELRGDGGREGVVIENAFPLQPRPAKAPGAGLARPVEAVWFSQTIGPGRGLELLIDAWGAIRSNARLTLIGNSRASYLDQLLARLPADRRGSVSVRGFVASDALPEALAAFDLGFALERFSPPNKDVTISNKILQYLNAGVAVLASATRGQSEIFADFPQAGLLLPRESAREVADLAEAIDALCINPSRLELACAAARAAAESRYCWEKQAPRLLAAVEQALQPQSR